MKIIQNKYKKVVDFCYELFGIAKLPLHKSKFSNKMFTQYQHLFMLVYKQFRKFTYKELLEDIASNRDLRIYLGLNRLPHYTTIIKFAKRLPCIVLDKLTLAFKTLFDKPNKVAIDATGISLDNASPHYCKRIGLTSKKRPFLKLTILVDIMTKTILLFKVRKKPRHDTVDAKPMIKKLAKNYNVDVLFGDRGYDDNELFKLVAEELEAYPMIYQKNQDVPKHKRKGEYRKQTFDAFDYGEYLSRNLVETVISILKRKFGFSIRSINTKCQKVELMTRIIAYNIDRILESGKQVILIFIKITRVSY